jgi:hypothetical protein
MAFSYGFYNSLNHDRVYDALQLSMIFDGVISDGIYATVDECMIVKASDEENTVIVQPGRGWFNHTWNYNDANLPMVGDDSELVLDRIDALVIDVNRNESYRENSIQWVKGIASSNPTNPTLTNNGKDHFQYPLAYVYRKANNNVINQADITNAVGTSECPFVTGVIDTVNIDNLLLQWRDQWEQFVADYENNAKEWTDEKQNEFNEWFTNVKYVLDGDAAGKLQNEIDDINSVLGNIDVTSDGPVQQQLERCFKSASNGKSLVASAITGMGVETASDATYAVMAENITNIKTHEGTATVDDVLIGKTFSNDEDMGLIGAMPNHSGESLEVTNITQDSNYVYIPIPKNGYYNSNSKLKVLNDYIAQNTKPYILTITASCSQDESYNWSGSVSVVDAVSGSTIFSTRIKGTYNFTYNGRSYTATFDGDTRYGEYNPYVNFSLYDNTKNVSIIDSKYSSSINTRVYWNGTSYQGI